MRAWSYGSSNKMLWAIGIIPPTVYRAERERERDLSLENHTIKYHNYNCKCCFIWDKGMADN